MTKVKPRGAASTRPRSSRSGPRVPRGAIVIGSTHRRLRKSTITTVWKTHRGDRPVALDCDAKESRQPRAPRAGRLTVDDEWRRWIAENLMIGQSPESILEAMIVERSSPQDRPGKSTLALQSPYLKGSQLLLNRLEEARLAAGGLSQDATACIPSSAEIERRHQLSRDEFLREYYTTNRPVIITGMMDDWPAMRKWNLDYFAEQFGDRVVEVQMGRTAGANYETEREKFIQQDPIR